MKKAQFLGESLSRNEMKLVTGGGDPIVCMQEREACEARCGGNLPCLKRCGIQYLACLEA